MKDRTEIEIQVREGRINFPNMPENFTTLAWLGYRKQRLGTPNLTAERPEILCRNCIKGHEEAELLPIGFYICEACGQDIIKEREQEN